MSETILTTCDACDSLGGYELTLEDELYSGPGTLATCFSCKGLGWVKVRDDEMDEDEDLPSEVIVERGRREVCFEIEVQG